MDDKQNDDDIMRVKALSLYIVNSIKRPSHSPPLKNSHLSSLLKRVTRRLKIEILK